MKPLIVLLVTFAISLLYMKLSRQKVNYIAAGNVAMASMMFFTSIGHFMYLQGMSNMLPLWVPARQLIIIVTGIVEIAAGIGLLINRTRITAGRLLILFFILVLPANIYAAIHFVNFETGKADGPGPSYLWFRVPLQLVFILWVYFFAVRKNADKDARL